MADNGGQLYLFCLNTNYIIVPNDPYPVTIKSSDSGGTLGPEDENNPVIILSNK